MAKGDDPKTDHRGGFTRISRVSPGLASQRDRFLTAKQGRLLHQRHSFVTPRSREVGTPSWAGPLTTSLRGLWASGYLPRAMADRARGRRPENRPRGDDSDPGLASRRESDLGNCHETDRSTLEPAWAASTHSEGKGPENPGVVAPLAAAGCRGNRRRVVDRRSGTIDLRP